MGTLSSSSSERWHDIRLGFRMLFKSRLVSIVTIVSLALGIGANTVIFGIINGLLWHGLTVQNQDKLISTFTTDVKTPGKLQVSYLNYLDYKKQDDVFSDLLAYRQTPLSLVDREHAERVVAETVTGNYFRVLGISPMIGRVFDNEDDQLKAAPTVVLSYDFWQRRFGGTHNVIGSTLTLNTGRFTVIGVAPKGFSGLDLPPSPDLWIPLMVHAQIADGQMEKYQNRRYLLLNVVGRLRDRVSINRAQAELETLAENEAEEYPLDNQGRGVVLVPLTEARINPDGKGTLVRASVLLMLVVGLVLLIACANVAGLLLSRAKIREKEIALRLSLGASRSRLVKQLLTESCVLSFSAGLVGLFLVYMGTNLLEPWLATQTYQVVIDSRVLMFVLGVSLLAGILFGLAPALQFSRPGVIGQLKSRGDAGSRQTITLGFQKALIAVQMALCLVSVTVALMFVKSLTNAREINPGFFVDRLLLLQFDVAFSGYDGPRGKQFYKDLVEHVRNLPGVENAAVATDRPFVEPLRRTTFRNEDSTSQAAKGTLVRTNSISPEYLDTAGVALVAGRNFTSHDDESSAQVVIVNEAMAKLFWPGRDPIGQQIRIFKDKGPRVVVGVVKDANAYKLGESAQPYQYLPFLQSYYSEATLYIHTFNEAPTADGVTALVKSMDPTILIYNVHTMRDMIGESLWETYAATGFLASFGVLALFLACVGIYGLMSYFVNRKTREIGVRIALGAQRPEILKLIFRQAAGPLIFGLIFGVVTALLVARLLSGMLFGVGTIDLPAILGGIAILVLIALLATYIPARRAVRISPMVTLVAE
jgi:putative ABC transport system permease protein